MGDRKCERRRGGGDRGTKEEGEGDVARVKPGTVGGCPGHELTPPPPSLTSPPWLRMPAAGAIELMKTDPSLPKLLTGPSENSVLKAADT